MHAAVNIVMDLESVRSDIRALAPARGRRPRHGGTPHPELPLSRHLASSARVLQAQRGCGSRPRGLRLSDAPPSRPRRAVIRSAPCAKARLSMQHSIQWIGSPEDADLQHAAGYPVYLLRSSGEAGRSGGAVESSAGTMFCSSRSVGCSERTGGSTSKTLTRFCPASGTCQSSIPSPRGREAPRPFARRRLPRLARRNPHRAAPAVRRWSRCRRDPIWMPLSPPATAGPAASSGRPNGRSVSGWRAR